MEVLGVTENRYSGIPTIRKELKKNGLPEPLFEDQRGQFSVTFFNTNDNHPAKAELDDKASGLVEFCRTPRTRQEIADYLGLSSISYAIKDYVMPLVDKGMIKLSIPDKPRSPKQLYFSE